MAHLQMDLPEDVNTIIADAVGSGAIGLRSVGQRIWMTTSSVGSGMRPWQQMVLTTILMPCLTGWNRSTAPWRSPKGEVRTFGLDRV